MKKLPLSDTLAYSLPPLFVTNPDLAITSVRIPRPGTEGEKDNYIGA